MPTTETTAGKINHTIEQVVLPNQLFTLDELVGKTITEIKKLYADDGYAFALFFSDETFVILAPRIETNYGEVTTAEVDLQYIPHYQGLWYLSLLTKEEYEEIDKKVKHHYELEETKRKKVLYNKLKRELDEK